MESRFLLSPLAALLIALPAFAQTQNVVPKQDPRIPALLHSLEEVKSIRETQISPDGNLVAWTVGGGGIVLAPLSNPAQTRHVTACAHTGASPSAPTADRPSSRFRGHEGGLAWSPDSRTLAFFSDCSQNKSADSGESSQKMALFTEDVATPNAVPHQLASLNGFAKSLEYSPDGKYLSFLYVEGATRPSGALAAMKPPSGVIGVEGLEVQRVAAVDASAGNLTQITPANLHVYEFSWSKDAKNLTFIAAPPPGEDNWWTAMLYVESVAEYDRISGSHPDSTFIGRDPHVAFDPNTTIGPLHGLQIAVPRFSPDGGKIALIGGLMSDQGPTGGNIYTIPATGGEATDVTPDRPATPAWFTWIDEQRLGIAEMKGPDSHLFVYNINTQQESPDINLTLPDSVGAGDLEMRISTSQTNNIAFIESSFDHAPEVWAGPLNDLKQITHYNDNLKPAWGKSEPITWTNEGFHINGWLLYPANYDPAKKYPMIVMVHGGPSSAAMPRWPYSGFGSAPFSALGYFVLDPNPRGSYGEGEKFTQANRKDFGYGDLRDILAGVDTVEKTHPVDNHRIGITGWSYGGFMTMFAITQTHRFRAAVGGAGISDWLSYYGENSIDQWMLPFFGASVYDDPAVYAKSSAINYIKNATTPTLVVVGDRDGECPAPQSFEFWHALRDLHVPTELVVYADEGHGFSKPEDRINVLERAVGWFDQYMK
ncbi:MAG TPA: S9 family peptidase [Silvibacterium sp.]|nr:S9 family peptidase [Silvibacterium sp.]